MTQVTIENTTLVVEVQGLDKLWSMKSRLEIPLEHVRGVRIASDERASGFRAPGTRIPGVITAGTFYHDAKRVFWDVHDPAKAIAIDLHDDRYSTLIIEVADPAKTLKQIESSLAPKDA